MRELLQVRFGEIHLKGQNRPYFMRMLVERVREAVRFAVSSTFCASAEEVANGFSTITFFPASMH